MMRVLQIGALAALLAGCTFGASGSEIFQAEGVTVVLAFQQREEPRELSGELLAVEDSGFLVDAVGDSGRPERVVRVPFQDVYSGEVYAGMTTGVVPRRVPSSDRLSPEERASRGRLPSRGPRRIARLTSYGNSKENIDLRALSRFPDGITPALLERLLDARGQDAVLPHTDAPSRPSPL